MAASTHFHFTTNFNLKYFVWFARRSVLRALLRGDVFWPVREHVGHREFIQARNTLHEDQRRPRVMQCRTHIARFGKSARFDCFCPLDRLLERPLRVRRDARVLQVSEREREFAQSTNNKLTPVQIVLGDENR